MINIGNRKYKDYNKEENGIKYRKCCDCERWFELNENNFKVRNNSKSGFSQRCSTCQEKHNHEYYMSTRDKQIADAKQWMKDHYERHRELHKRYERSDKHKEYRKRNHEDMKNKGWFRNWYKNHPDRSKEYRDNHRDHDITDNEWISCQAFFDFTCAYCGKSLDEQYKQNGHQFHKEHVNNDGYNDVRNCVPACTQCNSTKNIKSIDELLINNIIVEFTQDKFNKITLWCTEEFKKYIEPKPPYKCKMKRIYNNDGTWNMQHELWTVDEKRNIIECIATAEKKQGLNKYIHKYFPKEKK